MAAVTTLPPPLESSAGATFWFGFFAGACVIGPREVDVDVIVTTLPGSLDVIVMVPPPLGCGLAGFLGWSLFFGGWGLSFGGWGLSFGGWGLSFGGCGAGWGWGLFFGGSGSGWGWGWGWGFF